MLIPVLLFILGFVLLIVGGNWFVDGAVGIAHRFHLPELLIGATVVSIGTTLPEVMVSSQAALAHNSGISYGNAIGSIICNTSLIAALTIAARPAKADRNTLRLPVCFFFLAAVFYAGQAYIKGSFSRTTGLILLVVFLVYMVLSVLLMKTNPPAGSTAGSNAPKGKTKAGTGSQAAGKETPLWKDLLFLIVGAAAIAVGANLLVENGTLIAQALGVPDSVIGLTMIALGTSLPELVTAITSLVKGHGSLSLGNVIGANLFNLVLVSGMAITIRPFTIPAEKTIFGVNSSLAVDIPVMFLVMLILTVPTLIKGKLSRWQGFSLLAIYAVFTAYQFLV